MAEISGPAEARVRLCRRLAGCRRLLLVCGPGFYPAPRVATRGAEIVAEMARYYRDLLLLDEETGQALWLAGVERREGDAASLSASFLRGGADLCLAVGARLETTEAAGAWAAAWRAGAWLVEIGPPTELDALARECLRGDPELLLDDLWESFLQGRREQNH